MYNSELKTCEYCHSNIKLNSDVVICPRCQTPYHPDCWLENDGCAVYGCGYKTSSDDNLSDSLKPDELVEIEFLINERNYIEAINECKSRLKLDKNNVNLKRLYNKAVSHINVKTKLIEEGDNFFESGDYQNASVFYNRALRYCNEFDTSVIQSRLEIINHNIPLEIRRKRIGNALTAFIVIVMLFIGVASYYYFVMLEDEREFKKIESSENISDIMNTEIQISKYENFRQHAKDGKWRDKADEKINFMSAYLAKQLYLDDWRTAKKYLKKVNSSELQSAYREIDKRIYLEALKEFKERIKQANDYNKSGNYSESKYSIESAIEIVNHFPEDKFRGIRESLQSDVYLLKEKISQLVKYKNVIEEIREKKNDLGNIQSTKKEIYSPDETIVISGVVTGNLGRGLIAVKSTSGKQVALNTGSYNFSEGDYITLESIQEGKFKFINGGVEESIPMYIAVLPDQSMNYSALTDYERLAIQQRLAFLQSQKKYLDSLMNIKLKTH